MKSASLRISPLSILIVTLGLSGGGIAFAEDAIPMAEGEIVIEAKSYAIRTIRPSRSGRVYLFEKFESDLPEDGKLILLRDGDDPVMAFRVLKTYPETRRVAAKKLLAYTGFETLSRGSQYRAFEKTGEFAVAPVPPTPQDLEDLRDLEEIPLSPEADDVGAFGVPLEETPPSLESSPDALLEEAPLEALEEQPEEWVGDAPAFEEAPEGEPLPSEEGAFEPEPLDEGDNLDPMAQATEQEDWTDAVSEGDFTVEGVELKGAGEFEEYQFYYPNQVALGLGFLTHKEVPGPKIKFGVGALYSRRFATNWALEGGVFYYKSGGTWEGMPGVAMSVIPMQGTLQYHSALSETWTLYFYGGVSYSYVASSVGAPVRLLQKVQTVSPALGLGFLVQVGPNWYLRTNFGMESLSFGIALRF